MTQVTVFGATGAIGKLVVERLLDQGHLVRVYVRSPTKLPAEWGHRVEVVQGELSDAQQVAAAIVGVDAVISTLGTPLGKQPKGQPLTHGARYIVDAMKVAGVRRYIGIATPTVRAAQDKRSLGQKLMFALAARLFAEVVTMSAVITGSGLDWTLVRFLKPTDEAARGKVTAAYLGKGVSGTVTRHDIADFLVAQLRDTTWLKGLPIISN